MRLILARHGNTFGPGDAVYRVGLNEDLPLVEKGKEQAHEVAKVLSDQAIKAIYAAPLLRTKESAQVLSDTLGLPEVILDKRLLELDYGLWGGLSDEEITEQHGSEELGAWNAHGVWPKDACFGKSENEIVAEVTEFCNELLSKHERDDTVYACSSNGRLRYFLTLAGLFQEYSEQKKLKVRTGAICELVHDGHWNVLQWNVLPSEFSASFS